MSFLGLLILWGPLTEDGTPEAFLSRYCVECHGQEKPKRGLRLDRLPEDPGDPRLAAPWGRVLDRVSRGEMPPKGSGRPSDKEAADFVKSLETRLREASLARQREVGRVPLRRLNRVEYETTLRDLLGAPLEVKDLLPDDNVAAGFDKVSTALEISSSHLLRYQDAAEKALAGSIPTRPRQLLKDRRTGREITQNLVHWKEMLGTSARLEGETLVAYIRPWDYIPCATVPVPGEGRYRLRASLYAVGTSGAPMPVVVTCRDQYGRDDTDVRAVVDAPAGTPRVIEGTFWLKTREILVLAGWSLPSGRAFSESRKNSPIDAYRGPGLAVEWLEIEGPLDPWPPAGYRRLFGDVPLRPASVAKLIAQGLPAPPEPATRPDQWWIYDPLVVSSQAPREDAERLMREFLPLAFRRPVPEDLVRFYVDQIHRDLARGVAFSEAMLRGYQAVLCSPHFLFLEERPGALDDYALASRLSYFLWSSMPDRELLDRAARGELRKPEILDAEVDRLLRDLKATRFTANFAGQWLDLRSVNATSPDPELYGEFDDFLFWSMPRETELFFEEILRNDRSLTEFVHSDWTFLNERLARHYGVPGVRGGEFHRVKLPPECHRGGVLTQASVLKVTADGTRTSPVLRGKWVLDRILGQPPRPPPPDIPVLEPDIRGATTIRQQLDRHRNTPACAGCHRQIDPPGFALENFDVIGGWRDFYRASRPGGATVELANYPGRRVFRGLEVDATGVTPDGRPFKDLEDYKRLLLADPDALARSLAEKLIIYSTGGELQFADREIVRGLVAASREKNYGLRSLVRAVVGSRVFLCK